MDAGQGNAADFINIPFPLLTHRPLAFSRLHEVCIIENIERKKWHRAFCADPDIHKINCTALMVLLDLDDVLEIPYIRIWKLPPALAFPVLTIDCFIQGAYQLFLTEPEQAID